MKRIIFLMLLLLSINITIYAKDEPHELYAQSAVLMDGESGRVLFSKNGEDAMANASTTKIMTCILALEYGNQDDIVTASANAAAQPKVHLGVSEGDRFILGDLLYSLMLESHNDSAVMIAEHISGSEEAFALLMNQKAKDIGCQDTYFITPNGLDAEDGNEFHHTTATDLALIMKYCVNISYKKEEFISITETPSYSFQDIEKMGNYYCTNHNSLLSMMPEAISGKTGYTNDAGYCYVGAIESEGRTYIVTLLACGWPSNRNYKWSDARKLLEYGKDVYQLKCIESVSDEDELEMKVQLDSDKVEVMPLKIKPSEDVALLKKIEETVDIQYEYTDYVIGEIDANVLVGTVRYMVNGRVWKVDGIYTTESLKNRQTWWEFILDYFNV